MVETEVLFAIIPQAKTMENIEQGKPGGTLLDHSINTVYALETIDLLKITREEELLGWLQRYINKNYSVLKLSAFLHDIGKPPCYIEKNGEVHFYGHEKKGVEILRTLREWIRWSNKEMKLMENLILNHMRPHLLAGNGEPTEHAIGRLIRQVGDDIPGLLLLSYADGIASGGEWIHVLASFLRRVLRMYNETKKPKFKRLINGYDLINLGLTPGPIFKTILQEVEELQISGRLKTKDEAVEYVKRKYL